MAESSRAPLRQPTPAAPSRQPTAWRDPGRWRGWALQGMALCAVGALLAWLTANTLANLEQRGIASGFGFLQQEAGFGIIQSLIPYDESASYGRAFLVGLLNTLLVSILGIILATLLGLLIGVARLSPNWLAAKLAAFYIETIRNIPLLLQLFFWYFAVLRALPAPRQSMAWGEGAFLNIRGLYLPKPLPEPGFWWTPAAFALGLAAVALLWRRNRRAREETGAAGRIWPWTLLFGAGLPLLTAAASGFPLAWEFPELGGFNFRGGLVIIPELAALLLALTLYTAAFIAEIVRAGIQSVDRGQSEAARALGLGPGQTLWRVVLPQAIRVIVPPLTNQYLNLTKNSALAAAIAYPDLVSIFAGTVLNQTGQAVEVIAITMGVYLTISLAIAAFMNWFNRRSALAER